VRVAFSALAALAGLAVIWALEPVFSRSYFFPAFAALIVPAVLAGARYGALATLLTVAGYDFWFVEPRRTFGVASAGEARALIGLAVTGVIVALVGGRLRAVYSELRRQHDLLRRSHEERAELVRVLSHSEQSLREVDRHKDEFLGMLSHELRNPLAPIRNALYILDHAEPGGQQAARAKEVANRQLAHITRLVDDLLDVTRIARGKIELRRAEVDLAALTRRTAEDHRALMQDRGLELRVVLPPDPVVVNGDETRLTQVVGNLLHNAYKFTPAGGQVALTVGHQSGRAVVHVRDTGVGMDTDTLRTIFEPFIQAKQTLARSEGGLGLGLALVKGLVTMHGGDITARSAGVGRGTEFFLTIPLDRRRAVRSRQPARRDERSRARRHRVLVVEDNHDAAETLAELLKMEGHEVAVAHDGPNALTLAQAQEPDVVLCDIGLPGMDGYEVGRQLRARCRPGLRLVAVSGYAQPEDLARASESGFDAHIAKPADPHDIVRLLA
jgi:signal transduction histidine kinase